MSPDGRLLGSAETLQDFYPILDAAAEEGKVYISLYANIELLDFSVELQDAERYPPKGDFVRIIEATDSYIESLITPEILSNAKDGTFYENSGHYSMAISPLLDYHGEQVGVVVCAMNTKVISDLANAAEIIMTIMIAFLAIGPTFALIMRLRVLATRPLGTIKLKIQDIAEDRADLTEKLPVCQEDEIGELAQWFNTLTAKLDSIITERQEMAHWYKSILDSIPFIIYVQDADGKWTFINKVAEVFLGKDMESVIGLDCSSSGVSICNTENCAIAAAKRGEKQTRFYAEGLSYQVDIETLENLAGDITGYIEVIQDITELENLLEKLAEQEAEAKAANRAKSSFLANMSHEIRTPMNAIIGMTDLALQEDISPDVREHILTIKQSGSSLLSLINDILDFSKIEAGRMEIVPTEYLFSSLVNDLINIFKAKIFESRLRFLVNIDNNIPNALYGDPIRIRQVVLNIVSNAVKYTEKGFIALSVTGDMCGDDTMMLKITVKDSGIGIKQEDIDKLFGEFSRLDLTKTVYIEGTGLGLAITQSLVDAMEGSIEVTSTYGEGSVFTITLPQKVMSDEKLAVVENPDEKKCLIYERREKLLHSIMSTMDGLGVSYTYVATESDFIRESKSNAYAFVIVSSALFERVKERYEQTNSGAKIILATEYSEALTDNSYSTLTTPIYCLPVANVLNGLADDPGNTSDYKMIASFTAPAANVLVVDDINTNLKVAGGLLKPYGFHLDLCKSGLEAIRAVKNKHYDVILMDHMMPEMDGVETVAYIRAMSDEDVYYKIVPIIALTANAVIGTKEMLLDNGFDDFLGKPIDTIKLNSVLQRWIPAEKQILSAKEPIQSRTDSGRDPAGGLKIADVDVGKGVALVGGSLENYLDVLSTFHKDGMEKTVDIKKCMETDDMALYTVNIHALKSVLLNIGAGRLSGLAKELETAGRQEDYTFIRTNHDAFMTDFEALLGNISEVISKPGAPDDPPDMALLLSELAAMKEALALVDSELVKKASGSLREHVKAAGIGSMIETILQSVFVGEYEEAETLIGSLMQEFSNGNSGPSPS